ncbi:MAG: hypothetical protein PHC53_05010 [Patescibacteria group bacterium]|nr:hypothetical protein [Patescibacteria group bacterium]
MRKSFWAVLALLMLISVSAKAELKPARARLLLHGSHEINDTYSLKGDFIPSGNLLAKGQLCPMGYMILGIQPLKWLNVAPSLGFNFGSNELILDTRLQLDVGPTYFWGLVDAQPASWDAYWFAQLDIKAMKWFHVGLEEESWGNYKHGKYSHGAGPNMLFRFGTAGIDLAMHRRYYDADGAFGTEFLARFHVFLPDSK